MEITKQELFQSLPTLLSRTSPFVITEIHLPENRALFDRQLLKMEFHYQLMNFVSPYSLFLFLSEHQNDLVILEADIAQLSKAYIDIIQGAICSSPDSGTPWTVEYLDYPEFTFRGKLILCTELSKKDIKRRKRFANLVRDCHFI
ncbi:MAG: hypothetical protein ACI85O_003125 [Saprospiraceae bacterium]|jgi:hypothetical protein